MKSFPLNARRFAAAAVFAVLVTARGLAPGQSAAADAPPFASDRPAADGDLARLAAADRTIVKALQQPTQMRFKEQRLNSVVAALSRQHGIRIRFDEQVLRAAGILPDNCLMTERTGDISLHSALRLLLDDLGLTYVVNRGVLLITTPSAARRLLREDAIAPAAYWKSSPAAAAAKQRIAKELSRPVRLECFKTPWGEALESLKKQARVEIQLDRRALADAGVEVSLPTVTLDLEDVPFTAALGQLVRKAGLTYVVDDDFILITTVQKAKARSASPLPPGESKSRSPLPPGE